MVGSRNLWDFLYGVLTGPTYRDLPAEYWRDTSPSYYILRGSQGAKQYVDGADIIDIPDFHSVDISAGLGSLGIPLNFNMSYIDDRFGNQYLTFPDVTIDQSIIEVILARLGKNISISFPIGATYSEGYACASGPNVKNCVFRTASSLAGSNYVYNTITGPCYGAGGIVALGGKLVTCSNGNKAMTFSYGYAASIGGTGSYGIYIRNDPSSGWDWAIQDRLNGVSYAEVVLKAWSKEH
jgi:hypothetical protein